MIPALVDAHSHLGYTDVRTGVTAATSYTRDNLLDHLRRYAYYGIAATLSLGLDRGEIPYELRAPALCEPSLWIADDEIDVIAARREQRRVDVEVTGELAHPR